MQSFAPGWEGFPRQGLGARPDLGLGDETPLAFFCAGGVAAFQANRFGDLSIFASSRWAKGGSTRSVWVGRFNGAFLHFSTLQQMDDEGDEGEDEDDVDEAAGDVEAEADGPADEEDDGDDGEHGMTGFSLESGMRWVMAVFIFAVR